MTHTKRYTFLALTLLSVLRTHHLNAQASDELARNTFVESRLKAIYERVEFRGNRPRMEWFPNNSGYAVWERNPKTNNSAPVGYDLQSGNQVELTSKKLGELDHQELLSPNGKSLLEYRAGNLFVRELESGQRTQLTNRPAERDVSYRDPVWSSDSQRIVFVESDQTNVRQRSVLVPSDPSYPGVRHDRFARVGEKISTLRVGVVNSNGTDAQWLPLDTPEEGFYLGQVAWANNSTQVLIEKLSRFRDTREFLIVPMGGQAKRIYSETNSAWAIASQGTNLGLTWIRDGQEFIVNSEKDGWRHAFLYSRDGDELAVLTPGEYDIIDRAVVDEQEGWYYFYASPDNGTQKYLYRVKLDGSGGMELITPADQPGTHDYQFSPDAKWAFHTYSGLDTPPIIELVKISGHKTVRVLEHNQKLREKMKGLISQPTEFLQIDIGDEVSLDAWMLKPKDFDPSKKYPLFIYVYGEPHLQTVLDKWGAAQIDFHRVIADLGYLVVSIDNRGTPCPKGAAWRRSIFGKLGPLSTEDQAAALKELGRARPYVDLSRVGIWGWSGGGSNTLNAMFRKPDLYQVGIAVVPKPQPHLYNAWFQEIYMRTREVNREGYEKSAPLNFAEGLTGDLMIITGSGETNTHIQIIEGLVDRLIELGKSFDYMVYPNRDHGLREGAGSLVHVRKLIIRYLLDHLPSGEE